MNKRGLTLIELLIAIAIFSIVLGITFESYMSIVKVQKQQVGIASSNIGINMSLEVMRKDFEMAGFGLPRQTFGCSEAVSDPTYTPNPASLNTPDCTHPLPITFSNNSGPNQSDAVAIRSSVAVLSNYTQHWGYVYYDYATGSLNFVELGQGGRVSNVYFTLINPITMSLVEDPCKLTDCTVNPGGDIYLAFGLDDNICNMPFNRVDYYLYRPSTMPERCAPGTYELYRATINQSNGKRNPQPIIDCVEDLQIEFGLDTNGDGVVDKWIPSSTQSSLPTDLYTLDTQLKQVRIFLVVQEGKKDPNFTYNGSIKIGDGVVGVVKTFTPATDQLHYRWRLLEIVVNPVNILPQQRNIE